MAIPWHRFLKLGLNQVFSGSSFEVQDEFDLSDPQQLVDFVVLRRSESGLPDPDPSRLPDGLQELKDHNLISYKSMNEAFDRFALNELVAHAVAYSKLQDRKGWKQFSDQLGLIAVTTRKPSTEVISSLLQETEAEDIYEIDCAGWKVTCVVINRAPPEDRNWLWGLMKGERTRWKSGRISAIFQLIESQLKNMETLDPEIEAFENQILESWLEELPPEKRILGLDLRTTREGQDLIEEAEENIIIKQAKAKFSGLSEDIEKRIRELPGEKLEDLAVALFQFNCLGDLETWLKDHS